MTDDSKEETPSDMAVADLSDIKAIAQILQDNKSLVAEFKESKQAMSEAFHAVGPTSASLLVDALTRAVGVAKLNRRTPRLCVSISHNIGPSGTCCTTTSRTDNLATVLAGQRQRMRDSLVEMDASKSFMVYVNVARHGAAGTCCVLVLADVKPSPQLSAALADHEKATHALLSEFVHCCMDVSTVREGGGGAGPGVSVRVNINNKIWAQAMLKV